ncbi:hypothetical protein E2320_013004, partial [Naja naja]
MLSNTVCDSLFLNFICAEAGGFLDGPFADLGRQAVTVPSTPSLVLYFPAFCSTSLILFSSDEGQDLFSVREGKQAPFISLPAFVQSRYNLLGKLFQNKSALCKRHLGIWRQGAERLSSSPEICQGSLAMPEWRFLETFQILEKGNQFHETMLSLMQGQPCAS